jgi:hypothetical protein
MGNYFQIINLLKDNYIMKYLKLFFFLFITNYSYAQYGRYTTSNIAVSLIEPGIGLEYSIAPKTTIRLRTAITAFAQVYQLQNSGVEEVSIAYSFHPIASFAIRNYYNIEKRSYKRRRIDYNSANYFSLSAIYLFKNINEQTEPKLIPPTGGFIPSFLWGFQRSFSNKLFFDINFGPGYHINESIIMPMGEISLGIHL